MRMLSEIPLPLSFGLSIYLVCVDKSLAHITNTNIQWNQAIYSIDSFNVSPRQFSEGCKE